MAQVRREVKGQETRERTRSDSGPEEEVADASENPARRWPTGRVASGGGRDQWYTARQPPPLRDGDEQARRGAKGTVTFHEDRAGGRRRAAESWKGKDPVSSPPPSKFPESVAEEEEEKEEAERGREPQKKALKHPGSVLKMLLDSRPVQQNDVFPDHGQAGARWESAGLAKAGSRKPWVGA